MIAVPVIVGRTNMKKLGRILGVALLLGVLLLATGMVYSTVKGYTTWYFRVNGAVTVDGHETTGYLHANSQHTFLLVTRTDAARPQTYLVPLASEARILDCGEWQPIRFVPNPVGDGNPSCNVFTGPANVRDAPIQSTAVRRRNSVEFSTVSGKRVRAEW